MLHKKELFKFLFFVSVWLILGAAKNWLGGVYSFEQQKLLLAFSRHSNYENDRIFVAFANKLVDPRILYTMGSKKFRSHRKNTVNC
jgi:hypothetical protein